MPDMALRVVGGLFGGDEKAGLSALLVRGGKGPGLKPTKMRLLFRGLKAPAPSDKTLVLPTTRVVAINPKIENSL